MDSSSPEVGCQQGIAPLTRSVSGTLGPVWDGICRKGDVTCMLELPQLPGGRGLLKVPGRSHHPALLSSEEDREVRIIAAGCLKASHRVASAEQ